MSNKKSITDFLTNTDVNLTQTERLISGVAGGGLLAYGLKRGGASGATLAVVGPRMTPEDAIDYDGCAFAQQPTSYALP